MTTDKTTRKKITWVTPDHFVDCDFNPAVLSGILKTFDIYWIILLPAKNARFAEAEFDDLKKKKGITIEFFYYSARARSPKMLLFYEKVYRRIKQLKGDLTYFNYVPTSPFVLPLYWRLNKNKTIVTAHEPKIKPEFKMAKLSRIFFKLAFDTVKYVNLFSHPQELVFKSAFPKPETFVIPLGLKDFGPSNAVLRNDNIIFLFFGTIIPIKNVGILIDAACNLFEKGRRGFKVSINGSCSDWENYSSKIKYPEIFECDIRLIKNTEIPDLFTKSHYAVFPYKEMSQSGALKIAFNYCVPVITSNLEGFANDVAEGTNGFMFQSENVKDLERVMAGRLDKNAEEYKSLHNKIIQYNKTHYSPEALITLYTQMFNEVLLKNN